MEEIKSIFIGVLILIKKYTCIPIKINIEDYIDNYNNIKLLLPFLGLVFGFIMFLISLLGYIYNKLLISIILVLLYCWMTKNRTFHELNTLSFEFFSIKKKANDLSNTFIILNILLYVVLFGLVPKTAIFITPILGYSSILLINSIAYNIRKNINISKYFGNMERIFALITVYIVSLIINYKLIIPASFTFIIIGLIFIYIDNNSKKIILETEGLVIEVSQLLFLIFTYILRI